MMLKNKNRNKKQLVLLIASPTLVVLALVGLLLNGSQNSSALSGSQFKAGHIISDSRFFNHSNMSAAQIQNFLNAKVPKCDTWGEKPYAGTTRAKYAASRGVSTPFKCLKNYKKNTPVRAGESGICDHLTAKSDRTAARIIKDVSKACGVSPKVLIVLLQKEQSLITDDWPWPIQYRSATGYGCPDTAPCDSEYYGFFNQVYNAARIYKVYAHTNGPNYRKNQNNFIYWHPNTSCGGSTVFIQNQATAGLYNYTPYRPNKAALNNLYGTGNSCSSYGNRNFWRMYTDWFGSTTLQWGADITEVSFYNDSDRTDSLGSISSLTSGRTVYVTIKAKNTGRGTWHNTFVRLGTVNPANRKSEFKDDSWLSHNRPAVLEESAVSPSGTGTFKFSMTAPGIDKFYGERFRIVADGKNQGWMGDDPKRQFNITVSNPYNGLITKVRKYRNSGLTQPTDTKALIQDQKAYIKVKAKNTGQNTWSGAVNTRIATVNPHSSSPFSSDNWREHNRPAYLSESSVAPGQTGTFIFEVDAPSTNGTYTQPFQLVSDGQSSGWMPSASFTLKSKIVESPMSNMFSVHRLYPGQQLTPHHGSKYKAVLQGDGNFVVYSNGKPLWHSHTNNSSVSQLVLQSDGNLVLYRKGGKVLWHTHTARKGKAVMKMQSDGNLVIYNGSGKPIWHTATHNK
jgi:hypothetical protein